jgi:hypothetical protein
MSDPHPGHQSFDAAAVPPEGSPSPERSQQGPDDHGRLPVTEAEEIEVFRVVGVSDPEDLTLWEWFRSDEELGEDRLGRDDVEYAAVSTSESFDAAAKLVHRIAERHGLAPGSDEIEMGNYAARVALRGGHGVLYRRDRRPKGHVSIWGDPRQLATMVAEIRSVWAERG